jgi:hypothetical protein
MHLQREKGKPVTKLEFRRCPATVTLMGEARFPAFTSLVSSLAVREV